MKPIEIGETYRNKATGYLFKAVKIHPCGEIVIIESDQSPADHAAIDTFWDEFEEVKKDHI